METYIRNRTEKELFISELRVETANNNFYLKKDGSGTKSTASALIAAIYKF